MEEQKPLILRRLASLENAIEAAPPELFDLLLWVLISLASISLLSDPPLLALAFAIGGGIFLGLDVHRAYERLNTQRHELSRERAIQEKAGYLHWPIMVALGLNYAWFIFKDRPPTAGLILLGALLILRIVRRRALFCRTPQDLPIVLLLILALLSGIVLTVEPSLSIPKLWGILLGLTTYYEVAYGSRRVDYFQWWLIALSVLGVGMAAMGVLGADWFSSKLLDLSRVYSFIPQKIVDVPRSLRGGFHPNGVAGTLIYVIPVYLMQLVNSFSAGNEENHPHPNPLPHRERELALSPGLATHAWGEGWCEGKLVPLTLLTLVLTGITLLLTQSRGALMGLGIASVALFFAWRRRWIISLAAIFGLVALAAVLLQRFPELLGSVEMGDRSVSSSYQFRLTVWQIALMVIQDFPFFSAGIGVFDLVARLLYPLYPQAGSSGTITHAHNELLQVTVDLGFPGLVAYVAMLAAFARTTWRAYIWAPDRRLKNIVLGLGAGMVAHQLFGLTDAFLLGTKPGVVMWIIMGLVTGLYLRIANGE